MEPLLNTAITAARQAGQIILRHLDLLDRIQINEKHGQEIFSEVDIKAEQAIIQILRKAYPSHGILAEESGTYEPEAEYTWIIDPLDGTKNYIQGFPSFAVSIACKINNRIEHGVIYDPLRHECFAASRGRGARLDDRRIRVSSQKDLLKALIGAGLHGHRPDKIPHALSILEALLGHCGGLRRSGSAALDLAYVACGRLDGFWEFGLRPWDIAAATLIIKEAGGLVSDIHGGETFLKTGDIAAGSPKIFKALLQLINQSLTA